MKNLLSRIIFRLYFVLARFSGGRDSSIAKLFAKNILLHFAPIPYERNGITLVLNPSGFIDWCLLARGGFEKEVLNAINGILRDGGTMLDIGANMGYFSIAAAARNPGVKVIAFEPSPRELSRIHSNLALNSHLPITVLPYACSTEAREDRMYLASPDNPGANSMVQIPDTEGYEVITIRSIVPNQIIDEETMREVRLVKIDVEGYEESVLAGLANSMEHLKKAVFIVEMNPPCLDRCGSSLEKIYEFFKSHGMEGLLGPTNNHADEDGKYDEIFFTSTEYESQELMKRIGW